MAKPSQKTFVVNDQDGPVECLGMTFPNDEARRGYFLAKLKEKLKDPEFRKIEGFPIGSDEDILDLSDPPYYTACPNPFLTKFLSSDRTRTEHLDSDYKREPFALDVSEARTDVIFTAHPYHTKVPPLAIARYILHFTDPGDVVLDAFSGSGMTGVACKLCSDVDLGSVDIKKGVRRAILCDLSPAATIISSVYLSPPSAESFASASAALLSATDEALGKIWTAKEHKGLIDFQVWTEEFSCPLCQNPVVSERVVDPTKDIGTAKEFQCPECHGLVSKAPSKGSNASRLERRLKTRFDKDLGTTTSYLPRVPVFAQIRYKGKRLRVETGTEERRQLESLPLASSDWYPTDRLIQGERYARKDYLHAYGITHVHHFFLPRQLLTYSYMWSKAREYPDYRTSKSLMFFVQSNCFGMTILNRYSPTHFSQVSQNFTGTLYVPSAVAETSHRYSYDGKRSRLCKAFEKLANGEPRHLITTQSSSDLRYLPDSSVDYVFVDPPFGRNLQYSELNQIWEAWLRVKTDRQPEAIMDATRDRELLQYASLMTSAFTEMYRVLKPNHWITVVFHNSSNAVWFAIQEALTHAGFVVADVRTLDRESDT
jgi:hypothetical protein